MPHSHPERELPDELAALRELAAQAADGPGDRAELATRSASLFLEGRRQRLRRELERHDEATLRAPQRRRQGR